MKHKTLFTPLHCLLLAHVTFAAVDPAFSTCPGPCTITVFSSTLSWRSASIITLSDSAEIDSLSSSLSASFAADTFGDPFAINLDTQATPPPKSVQTDEDGGYTTIPCCDDKVVYGFFLYAGGTTCGALQTGVFDVSAVDANLSDYNAAFATVVADSITLNAASALGPNSCSTETQIRAPHLAPFTKTFYPVLVGRPSSIVPAAPVAPSPITTGVPQMAQGQSQGQSQSAVGSGASQQQPAANGQQSTHEQATPVGQAGVVPSTPSSGGPPAGIGAGAQGTTLLPTTANNGSPPVPGGAGQETQTTAGAPAPPRVSAGNTLAQPPEESIGSALENVGLWAMLFGLILQLVIVSLL